MHGLLTAEKKQAKIRSLYETNIPTKQAEEKTKTRIQTSHENKSRKGNYQSKKGKGQEEVVCLKK